MWCATAYPWSTLTSQISSLSVYFVALWRQKPQISTISLTSAFCGDVSWQRSEKVEHGCTTTSVSTSFLYSNAFMTKSGAQSLTFKSVTNRQIDKQTDKKLNVFRRPGGGRNPIPMKLGTVIEDLEHVLAPLKLLGSDT